MHELAARLFVFRIHANQLRHRWQYRGLLLRAWCKWRMLRMRFWIERNESKLVEALFRLFLTIIAFIIAIVFALLTGRA